MIADKNESLRDELHAIIDKRLAYEAKLLDEARDLRHLLGRVVGLIGKPELTIADQEQIARARKYLGEPGTETAKTCHYCDAEQGHTHGCPIRNRFELEEAYAEDLPA